REEMYVMSAKNKRVSIQLLGGDKIQELNSASLPFLEAEHFLTLLVSFASSVPDLKLLDLTGNLISVWEFMIDHLFLAFRKWVLFDFVNKLVRRWSQKSGKPSTLLGQSYSMSRMVMSKLNDKPEEIELLHPALDNRFKELKKLHGLDVERASAENPLVWTYLHYSQMRWSIDRGKASIDRQVSRQYHGYN
ncbi:hypothetical protein IGI04_006225, partial [Brassica rapa subsp. trilocularis]